MRRGCSAEPLIDGRELFARLKEELVAAKCLFVALSFCNDKFMKQLVRSVRPEVGVFVLAWRPFGANPLLCNGGLESTEGWPSNCHVQWTESAPDVHHCHHEKTFVVDWGRVTLTGGIIASRKWTEGHVMHDVGLALSGEASVDVARAFVQRWNAARGPATVNAPKTLTLEHVALANCGDSICQVTRSLRPGLIDANGEASILPLWIGAIRKAECLIYIEQQHTAHEGLVSELIAAVERGVRLVYLRPGREEAATLTNRPIDGALRGRTRPCYERVFLDLMPQLERSDRVVFCGLRGAHVHSKLLIVDDVFVAVGSANLVDISMDLSEELHTEICVGVYNTQFASLFRRRLWTEHTRIENASFEAFAECATRAEGNLFRMSPTEWGKVILPYAVSLWEQARPK